MFKTSSLQCALIKKDALESIIRSWSFEGLHRIESKSDFLPSDKLSESIMIINGKMRMSCWESCCLLVGAFSTHVGLLKIGSDKRKNVKKFKNCH
jgi:hypothetical protein